MQTWARRGLQTALVTGGLLMLGTGIASANENVNPDRPASPLDPQIKVPVRIHDNAVGTPLGQLDTPTINHDVVVSADTLTKGLPAGAAQGVAAPLTGKLPLNASKSNDPFRGNRVTGDLVIPIEFAGNAIAAGGDAHVDATSTENDTSHSPVWTNGSDGVLAGNVVKLDWALPVKVSGNAVAALGKATTHFVSDNNTTAGGDIVTKGTNGVLAGNVLSGQFGTPVQVTSNAVGAGGIAEAVTEMDDAAHAPGTITTDGTSGVVSGTGGGVPIALPVAVHGNAASAGGKALAEEKNALIATAGQAPGDKGPDYIATDGKDSVLSGTVAEPAFAGPASLTCNAATLLGGSSCFGGDTESVTKAGGSTSTNGDRSAGGGTIATAPLAIPVQGFANSVAAGGLTGATHHNSDIATAGGQSITSGNDAVLAGTNGNAPVAGPVEVFGDAVSGLGIAKADSLNDVATEAGGNAMTNAMNSAGSGSLVNPAVALPGEVFGQSAVAGGLAEALVGEHKSATAGGDSMVHSDNSVLSGSAVNPTAAGPAQVLSNTAAVLGRGKTDVCNEVITKAGGYTGTTGNDSAVSGNAVTPGVSLPSEVLGNGAALGGLSSSAVNESKTSTAGGATNTNDDAGVLSSNAATTSLAGPVQVFGNSAAGAGISSAKAVEETTAKAGGPVWAKGTGGAGSGNVADVPVALPAQTFGLAAGALGKATGEAAGDTTSVSGGGVTTDGKSGTISGNVASVPAAAAAQAFGSAAGVAGIVNSKGENSTDSTAGGDVVTAGQDGSVSGNVASVQALPIAQVFGLAAAGTGLVNGDALNDTVATSGGDIMTNGDRGSISGNLADVPVAGVGQVFGDAAAVGGTAVGAGPNETTAITGGSDTTSGKSGSLSGNLADVPVAGVGQVFGDAAAVGGTAVGMAPTETAVLAGSDAHSSSEGGSLSGNLYDVPLAAVVQVFGDAVSFGGTAVGIAPTETTTSPGGVTAQLFAIPVPIVANALTDAPNNAVAKADDTVPLIDLPISSGGLPINKLPSLPYTKSQSRSNLPLGSTGSSLPSLNQFQKGSALSTLDNMGAVTETAPTLNMAKLPPGPRLG